MKGKIKIFAPILLSLALLLITLAIGPATAQQPDQGETLAPAGTTNPTTMLYQGYVTVGDTPYDGAGYFKFAVVNAAGNTTYWSNDGASTGGSQPTASVSCSVKDGYFTVLLGDTSLSGMTQALSPSVFAGSGRHLRVWFAQSASGPFTQLSLIPIAAAPYALNAETLDGYDSDALQRRVSGACGSGNAIRVINTNGTVTCEPDDDTTYSAGDGLNLSGNQFSVDVTDILGTGLSESSNNINANTNYLQRRVSSTCGSGNAIRVINADGTVTCEPVDGGGSHDHWGETWSGSGIGLELESSSGTAFVAQSYSTSPVGTTIFGGNLSSGSSAGLGVEGYSADGIGVVGESNTGTGLVGMTDGYVDQTLRDIIVSTHAGVYGLSTNGPGGYFTSTNGYGVYGTSYDLDGVRGVSTGGGMADNGVYGETNSTSYAEAGVYGKSSDYASGVRGVSTYGYGVYGTSDSSYGAYGTSYDLDGVRGVSTGGGAADNGVYGETNSTYSGEAGVYGKSSDAARGVIGISALGEGIYGSTNYTATDVAGVKGWSRSGYGVHGAPWDGYAGVYGEAWNGRGGLFYTHYGGPGIYAESNWGYGAYISHSLYVVGNIIATGSKAGYVVDIVRNADEVVLQPGDVVAVVGVSDPILGEIPVMEVRRATSAMPTAVVGVVDQVFVHDGKPEIVSSACVQQREKIERERQSVATPQPQPDQTDQTVLDHPIISPLPHNCSASEGLFAVDSIQPGDYFSIVTMGAYKVIRVDASYGAIQPGDLLVASPNPGYAMKASNPQPGTIIGKALAPWVSGTGAIPVFITLH